VEASGVGGGADACIAAGEWWLVRLATPLILSLPLVSGDWWANPSRLLHSPCYLSSLLIHSLYFSVIFSHPVPARDSQFLCLFSPMRWTPQRISAKTIRKGAQMISNMNRDCPTHITFLDKLLWETSHCRCSHTLTLQSPASWRCRSSSSACIWSHHGDDSTLSSPFSELFSREKVTLNVKYRVD
jgi:hypothetical protein